MRAVDTLIQVSRLAGRLEPAGDQIRALLPLNCPTEVRAEIRQHKPQLLSLLRHKFLIVHSAVLGETVYFAEDEKARQALIGAGAEPCCIYTRDELCELVDQHRRAPFTVDELLLLHAAKRIFNGRIASV